MSIVDGNWKTFMARATVLSTMLGVVVFGAVKLAVADPGGPVTPDELTYAGVVLNAAGTAPVTGPVELSFTMRRADGAVCGPVSSRTTASVTGAFTARVETTGCSRGFFNGATIHYDVSLVNPAREAGPLTPDGGIPITPVPYARFADQAGVNNDCPAGYTLDTTDITVRGGAGVILCRRARDEVVRVGDGASAFWIDRYESTVWSTREGGGAVPANSSADDLPSMGLPKNGQWVNVAPAGTRPRSQWFAVSVRGSFAPASRVTWFQANALCRASGKRLPTGDEWIAAAQGSPDDSSRCNVGATGIGRARSTGAGDDCASAWGAQEMIGNLAEWTGEWFAGAGHGLSVNFAGVQLVDGGVRPSIAPSFVQGSVTNWGSGYGGDLTTNVNGFVLRTPGEIQPGIPAAALRGGNWTSPGDTAGIYTFGVDSSPTSWEASVGFRCAISR